MIFYDVAKCLLALLFLCNKELTTKIRIYFKNLLLKVQTVLNYYFIIFLVPNEQCKIAPAPPFFNDLFAKLYVIVQSRSRNDGDNKKNYNFLQDKRLNSIFLPINALFLQLIPQRLTNMGHPPSPPFDSTSGWPSTQNKDGPNVQQHIVTSSKEMDSIMLAGGSPSWLINVSMIF